MTLTNRKFAWSCLALSFILFFLSGVIVFIAYDVKPSVKLIIESVKAWFR
jgi:hypothetical protein